MKKSFFKSIRLAGLMLLGSLAMVSCYEEDDTVDYNVPVTPELPDAKYFLYCTVEDGTGNALEANVTVFFNNAEIAKATATKGAYSLDVTVQGAGAYSLKVEKDGYATVVKPAQQMFAVEKGSVGMLNFSIVMRKLSEESGFGVPDVTNEKVDDATMNAVRTSIVNYLNAQGETPELVKSALENVETSPVIVETTVDGMTKKLHATKVVIPVRFETTQRTVNYVSLAGYEIAEAPKAVKATDPVSSWKEQANKYFNVAKDGYTMVSSETTLDTQVGKRLMGYNIEMAIVTEDMTFTCGEEKVDYTGVIRRQVGSTSVMGIYVNKEPESSQIVEEIEEAAKEEVENAVVESVKNLKVDGATIDTENVKSEVTTVSVVENGIQMSVAAVKVTVPLELETETSAKEVKLVAPSSTGYIYEKGSIKSVRAIDPVAEWIEQANAFFGVSAPGFNKVMREVTYKNDGGYPIKGYEVVEYYIVRELVFECGEELSLYKGTVKYAVSGYLKPVFVDDSHDDSHDDHHDNGGTAWGGGTTGR